ncbi:MAG: hypothetical protein GX448_11125 [Planctomycetes bacterium]|nr:hypothetical protein [Planctomycetota bacterium]
MAEVFPKEASSADLPLDDLSIKCLSDIQSLFTLLDSENYDLRRWRGSLVSESIFLGLSEFFVRVNLPLCCLWLQDKINAALASEFKEKIDRIVALWGKWYWPVKFDYGDFLKEPGDYSEWLLDHPVEDMELDDFHRELDSLHDYLLALDSFLRTKLKLTEPTPAGGQGVSRQATTGSGSKSPDPEGTQTGPNDSSRHVMNDEAPTDGHDWLVVALSKKEIGLACGLPEDRKIADEVNALCRNCAIILKPKGHQQKHPRKWFVAFDTLPEAYAKRFAEYMRTYHGLKVGN